MTARNPQQRKFYRNLYKYDYLPVRPRAVCLAGCREWWERVIACSIRELLARLLAVAERLLRLRWALLHLRFDSQSRAKGRRL
jgi:hypothetical protein